MFTHEECMTKRREYWREFESVIGEIPVACKRVRLRALVIGSAAVHWFDHHLDRPGTPNQDRSHERDQPILEPPLSDLEITILDELTKESYTADALTARLEQIHQNKHVSTVKRALRRLMKLGKVDNKRGLGYFRTDHPPRPLE